MRRKPRGSSLKRSHLQQNKGQQMKTRSLLTATLAASLSFGVCLAEKATQSDDSQFPFDPTKRKLLPEIPVPQDKRSSDRWWEPSDEELKEAFNLGTKKKPDWDQCSDGILGSVVAMEKVPERHEMGREDWAVKSWSGSGWRGERVNQMFKIWSRTPMDKISLSVSDLKSDSGGTISRENLKASFIRYVIAGNRLAGDILEDVLPVISAPAQTTRPIWLRINIPGDAKAGTYKGTLEVLSAGRQFRLTCRWMFTTWFCRRPRIGVSILTSGRTHILSPIITTLSSGRKVMMS